MKDKSLRYRYSDGKSPYSIIHCEVTTRYDPEEDRLKNVSIVHNEAQFKADVQVHEEGIELLNIQYPFDSNFCPGCAENQPVMIWTENQIEPVSGWEENPEVDVVRM